MTDRRSLASGATHIREEERGLPPLIDGCDQGVWPCRATHRQAIRICPPCGWTVRLRARERSGRSAKGRSRCSVALTDRRGCPLRLRVTGGPAMTALRPRPEAAPLSCLRADRAYAVYACRAWRPRQGIKGAFRRGFGARNPSPAHWHAVAVGPNAGGAWLRAPTNTPAVCGFSVPDRRPGSGCVQTSTMLRAVPDGAARLRNPEAPRALAFRMPG